MNGVEVRTFVVDHHVVVVSLAVDDQPRSIGMEVRVDGALRWSSEEPGWRDPGWGIGPTPFVWSARRLVVVPLDPDYEPWSVDCDEDVVVVFPDGRDWLLVCETSVRLIVESRERSHLDLSDVVTGAGWLDDRLVLETGDHRHTCCVVRDDREPSPRLEWWPDDLERLA